MREVAASGLDAALIVAAANVRYLSGFTGTNGWLLLAADGSLLLTDPRYQEQAASEVVGVGVAVGRSGLVRLLTDEVREAGWRRVGFEAGHTSVDLRERIGADLEVEWVGLKGMVEALRRRKDAGEVEAIRRALRVSEAALCEVVGGLTPGCTERQLAAELEYACRRRGADGMAFETIVASGPRTARPHATASQRKLKAGEPLMIDMGCRLDGYCSDLTRMVWLGDRPQPEWQQLHGLVAEAQAAAIAAVRSGVAAAEVDGAARAVLSEVGYGAEFRHGTGHGVGLEIHEAPALSPRSEETLEAGMVLTIEPAVYQPASGGVRLEDMVCVGEAGCVRLTALGTDPMLPGTP